MNVIMKLKKIKCIFVFAKTGVINKQNDLLMHINTINSVSKEKNVIERYKNLLINFHDTIIYSLIRSDSLKNSIMDKYQWLCK